jgi:hypothetical protein
MMSLQNRLLPTPKLFPPEFPTRASSEAITAVTEEDFVVKEDLLEAIVEEDDLVEEDLHRLASVNIANGSATPKNNATGGGITAVTPTEMPTGAETEMAMSTTNQTSISKQMSLASPCVNQFDDNTAIHTNG